MESFLEIKGLNYTINKEKILNNVSFDIKNQGDIVCILGPSGIGKTTILKSIAGLRKIDSGSIILNKKASINACLLITSRYQETWLGKLRISPAI